MRSEIFSALWLPLLELVALSLSPSLPPSVPPSLRPSLRPSLPPSAGVSLPLLPAEAVGVVVCDEAFQSGTVEKTSHDP